jgi:hypothetical protein
MTAGQMGKYEEMEELQEKAFALQLQTNYIVGQATSNAYLGTFKFLRGRPEDARIQVQLGLDQALEISDFSSQAWCYAILGWIQTAHGEYSGAAEDLERAEQIVTDPFRQTGGGNPFLQLIVNLSRFALEAAKGNVAAARSHLLQPLHLAIMTSSRPFMSMVPPLAALIFYHDGRPRRAAELIGLTFSKLDYFTGWLKQFAPVISLQFELRESLGRDEYEACWKRGQSLELMATAKQVLKYIESSVGES